MMAEKVYAVIVDGLLDGDYETIKDAGRYCERYEKKIEAEGWATFPEPVVMEYISNGISYDYSGRRWKYDKDTCKLVEV